MKAKEIVAEIAKSQEYQDLVEFWELAKDDPEATDVLEKIYELLCVLEETIYTQRKAFLELVTRSCRPKWAPNKIYFGGLQNVQAARDAFVRQVKEQMPVFTKLMDLIQAEAEAEAEAVAVS